MQATTVHPHDAAVSILSDNVENHSRCSLECLLRTRRRRFYLLISMLMIVIICGFAIPLLTILDLRKNTQQPETTTNETLNSTIDINISMPTTLIDISFAPNSTLINSANLINN